MDTVEAGIAIVNLLLTAGIGYLTNRNNTGIDTVERKLEDAKKQVCSDLQFLSARVDQIEHRASMAHIELGKQIERLDTRMDEFVDTFIKQQESK